ncbi:MAG: CoA transferase [Sphingomonadales bacterium]
MNRPAVSDRFPARWEASGLAALTGHSEEAVLPERDFLARLDALLSQVEGLAALFGVRLRLDRRVFTGRAALMGLARRGQVSCNGSCRLIGARDGWIAVNLARQEDVGLVAAWLCRDVDEHWEAIKAAAQQTAADALVERAELLGLPVAGVPHPATPLTLTLSQWEREHGPRLSNPRPLGEGGTRARRAWEGEGRCLRVIDLSALWAGPLCGQLLTRIGCHVIKVESASRPDSARFGPTSFFEQLHRGQEFVALDFASPDGRTKLRDLILSADVVVEGSRPRALRQLGIDRDAIMAERPSLIWVSITAHGRDDHRVGFGDDAAAAAGLLAWDRANRPVFVGDAIADPIAGLTAAAGVFQRLLRGVGGCVDISLSGAAAWVAAAEPVPC